MPDWITFISIDGVIVYQANWYGIGATSNYLVL